MNQQMKSRKAGALYTILTAVLIFGVVLGIAGVASKYSKAFGDGGTLQVAAKVHPENLDTLELPSGLEAAQPIPVIVNVQDPSALQLTLSTIVELIPWIIGIWALLILRAIVGSIKNGDPFGNANVGRLRKLGMILLAFPLVAMLLSFLVGGILDSTPNAGLLNNSFSLDLAPVAAGLGVLVLAEVFAHGVRLREDIEGTV
ncbi:MAG: DUF2975 domain-containing protein [Actinomycetota bacterium]